LLWVNFLIAFAASFRKQKAVACMKYYAKYFFVVFVSLIDVSDISAQLGDPVYIQTFGEGNADPNTIGPQLSRNIKTDFTYDSSLCPQPGSYTLARRMNVQGCFNGEWIDLSQDNSPSDYGFFMLVNNNTAAGNRIVYEDTSASKNLCGGETYNFSVAIINTDVPSTSCAVPDFPAFELRVEDDAGNLIQKDTTQGIQYAIPPPTGYKFSTYGFSFIMPDNVNRLVIKITLLHEGYECGEDFAIDDVVISPSGPVMRVNFTNEDPIYIVKSACFKNNKTISMTGFMTSYYPNPALQWQQSIDSGKTWTDIAGATNDIYSATFSTPDTFLFRLTGADASKIANPNCRVVSNNIKVEVDGPPSGFTITNNSPVCAGQDLQFDAEGEAGYVWNGPNGFYDNIQSPHIPNVSLEDSGTYTVQVTSPGGCTATTTTHVIIKGIDVSAGPDTSICNGSAITLHASSGTSYLWYPANGLSDTTIQDPKVKPTATTIYVVKVTSADGCSDTAKAIINILNNTPVKAGFSGTQFLCVPFDTATFINTSTGDISSWQWNFGNGQTINVQDPPVISYYFSDNTSNYIVSLKVADSAGCWDSVYRELKVESNCYIAVPSAFTPNGDGLNDYLYPLNAYKATNLIFRVYNRFGNLIFETRDWTKKWDGTKNGMPQPTGTYIWVLDYNDANNKKVSLRGTSVLIR
jgi:gliding motility-associated-like protein